MIQRRTFAVGAAALQEKFEQYCAEEGGGSSEKFAAFIRSESVKWARVVKDANVKVDA